MFALRRTCDRCQAELPLFSPAVLCTSCKEREREKNAQAERQTAAEREQARRERIARRVKQIRSTLETGRSISLFETVYIPVDSIIPQSRNPRDFEIHRLREMGLWGWEVVGVIPRTEAVTLSNKSYAGDPSWGGGMGGNVIGVYLLLKWVVSQGNLSDEQLTSYVSTHLEPPDAG